MHFILDTSVFQCITALLLQVYYVIKYNVSYTEIVKLFEYDMGIFDKYFQAILTCPLIIVPGLPYQV